MEANGLTENDLSGITELKLIPPADQSGVFSASSEITGEVILGWQEALKSIFVEVKELDENTLSEPAGDLDNATVEALVAFGRWIGLPEMVDKDGAVTVSSVMQFLLNKRAKEFSYRLVPPSATPAPKPTPVQETDKPYLQWPDRKLTDILHLDSQDDGQVLFSLNGNVLPEESRIRALLGNLLLLLGTEQLKPENLNQDKAAEEIERWTGEAPKNGQVTAVIWNKMLNRLAGTYPDAYPCKQDDGGDYTFLLLQGSGAVVIHKGVLCGVISQKGIIDATLKEAGEIFYVLESDAEPVRMTIVTVEDMENTVVPEEKMPKPNNPYLVVDMLGDDVVCIEAQWRYSQRRYDA